MIAWIEAVGQLSGGQMPNLEALIWHKIPATIFLRRCAADGVLQFGGVDLAKKSRYNCFSYCASGGMFQLGADLAQNRRYNLPT